MFDSRVIVLPQMIDHGAADATSCVRSEIAPVRIEAQNQHDFAGARAAFESALKLSSGNPQATRLLQQLARAEP